MQMVRAVVVCRLAELYQSFVNLLCVAERIGSSTNRRTRLRTTPRRNGAISASAILNLTSTSTVYRVRSVTVSNLLINVASMRGSGARL